VIKYRGGQVRREREREREIPRGESMMEKKKKKDLAVRKVGSSRFNNK